MAPASQPDRPPIETIHQPAHVVNLPVNRRDKQLNAIVTRHRVQQPLSIGSALAAIRDSLIKF